MADATSYRPDIEERVRRLLAMAGDPNAQVNEAQPMAHVAAKLIRKHGFECGVGAPALRQQLSAARQEAALVPDLRWQLGAVNNQLDLCRRRGVALKPLPGAHPAALLFGGFVAGGAAAVLALWLWPSPSTAPAAQGASPSAPPPLPAPPTTPAPTFVPGASARVSTKNGQPGALHVQPGTGTTKTGYLSPGTVVQIIDGQLLGNVMWYYVQAGTKVGWMHAQILAAT